MNITRREILRFAGGSALGFLLTPIPWKALDDSALWTQNWPWIPEPGRGEVSYKFTACPLCPVSCGMRARCIGNQPVSLSGTKDHPFNLGALCPTGILAHHLRYHPDRVSRPLRLAAQKNSVHSSTMTLDEALYDISTAMKDAGASSQIIALIDGRPGRTVSSLFRQFAAHVPHGMYLPVEEPSFHLLASQAGKPAGSFGYDLDHAKTIVSFGTPLFDSWGTPARTAKYLEKKPTALQRVLQIETLRSRTAEMADQWIPIRPGTDTVFALGMAHIILKEKLYTANLKTIAEIEKVIPAFPPGIVAEVCGVSQEEVKETARIFSAHGPSIAVIDGWSYSRDAQAAVMLLNLLVGSVGKKGGITVRREVPTGFADGKKPGSMNSDIYSLPDHSIRMMVIDESLSGCRLPQRLLQTKLAEQGIIVSLSPFVTERPFCTQYVLPAPVFPESLTELSSPIDRGSSSIGISARLVPEPAGVLDSIQFIQRLAAAAGVINIESGTTEDLLKRRVAGIYKEKRGSIFNASNGQTSAVKNLASGDELWNTLTAGGCWMDSEESVEAIPDFHFATVLSSIDLQKLKSAIIQLMLVPLIERTVYSNSEISPLISKVGQESGLRHFGCRMYLNPKTAEEFAIDEKCRVLLQTEHGSMQAEACLDISLMPGIVGVCHTTDPQIVLELCETNSDGSVCPTPVRIQKV